MTSEQRLGNQDDAAPKLTIRVSNSERWTPEPKTTQTYRIGDAIGSRVSTLWRLCARPEFILFPLYFLTLLIMGMLFFSLVANDPWQAIWFMLPLLVGMCAAAVLGAFGFRVGYDNLLKGAYTGMAIGILVWLPEFLVRAKLPISWLSQPIRAYWLPFIREWLPWLVDARPLPVLTTTAAIGVACAALVMPLQRWWRKAAMARQARATRLARGHDISRVPLREIRELSVDGLPRLMWTDEFPTGLTKGMLLDRWEFRFHTGAIIVCAVIGLFVQGLPGLLGGAVIGAFLGGLARRNADPPDLRLPLTGNVAAPKKRQPSELELRLEAEHETVQEDCEAYLVEHNGELWFVIERGDRPRGQTRAQALPWESDAFGNFEEGDFSDWFRSPAKYSPVRGDRVVVIQPRGKAPVLVCHWAHEAAFTRHLRERLEEAFAGRARAELLERRRLLKQDVLAKGSTSPLATPDVQEIPKSL